MPASFGVTQSQLTAEAAARIAADTAEATARAAADSAESTARQSADAALDTRVDAVEAGGPVANLARFSSGNPANTLISAVDGSPVLAGSGSAAPNALTAKALLWQGGATRTSMNAQTFAQTAGVTETSQMAFVAPFDILGFAPVYAHEPFITGAEDLTIEFAGVQGANKRKGRFSGRTSTTLRPRGFVVGDFVHLPVTGGQQYQIATYVSSPTGGGWPTTRTILNSVATEGSNRGAGAPNLTGEADAKPAVATSTPFGPVAVLVLPRIPNPYAVVGIGDSILEGDDWLTEALFRITSGKGGIGSVHAAGAVPFINLGIVAATGATFVSLAGTGFRNEAMRHATHVFMDWGPNDLIQAAPSNGLATIRATLQESWDMAAAAGAEVIGATITPRTTSTDGWTTEANQTVTAGYNDFARQALNAWIRTVPPPLSAVIDKAAAVEGTDPSKWKATAGTARTGDGTHPNALGQTEMAAQVNTLVRFPIATPATRTFPTPAALPTLPALTTSGASYWDRFYVDQDAADGAALPALIGRLNGRDLVQANGAQQPTVVRNLLALRPVAKFDRTLAQFLKTAADATLTGPITAFIVYRADATSGTNTLLDGHTSGRMSIQHTNTTSLRLNNSPPSTTFAAGAFHIVTAIFDATASLSVDGGTAVTGTLNPSVIAGGLTIGANPAGGSPISAHVAETIIAKGNLNSTDIAAIVAQLKQSWEIA